MEVTLSLTLTNMKAIRWDRLRIGVGLSVIVVSCFIGGKLMSNSLNICLTADLVNSRSTVTQH